MTQAHEVEGTVAVAHEGGDRFTVAVRGHTLTTDQPVEDGGTDVGPSPTELFIAGLAACVGFYARRYLARHGLPEAGLEVRAGYSLTSGPTRVGEIRLGITLPAGIPEERRPALLAVASGCTVHNSLHQTPAVTIELVD
jgi:uncharacterized OsmC-like protein